VADIADKAGFALDIAVVAAMELEAHSARRMLLPD
jgi:hypothetical protein